jgi:glycosidase
MPAQVRVRLKRINCQEAEPYPPDGQAPEWWQRLKNAFGTASSAFVDASLQQLIAADATSNAGFFLAAPWLPVADDFRRENVENQRRDPTSMLNLYRRLIALRRARHALTIGSYRPIKAAEEVLIFVREAGHDRVLVALNMGNEPVAASFASTGTAGTLLLSSYLDRTNERIRNAFDLRPSEVS